MQSLIVVSNGPIGTVPLLAHSVISLSCGQGLISASFVQVNYWPSHVEHTNEHNAVKTTDLSHKIAGVRTREDIPKTNDFQQGGDRYRNLIAKDEKR